MLTSPTAAAPSVSASTSSTQQQAVTIPPLPLSQPIQSQGPLSTQPLSVQPVQRVPSHPGIHSMHSQGMPTHGIPVPGMPGQGMPTHGIPIPGMPSQGIPPQGMSSQGMPTQGMPPQGMPLTAPLQHGPNIHDPFRIPPQQGFSAGQHPSHPQAGMNTGHPSSLRLPLGHQLPHPGSAQPPIGVARVDYNQSLQSRSVNDMIIFMHCNSIP